MNLEIEKLRCVRAGRTVFANLSVRVARGEALILAGPNGAGKSTLLRILAGLLRADEGDARLGDVSLREDRAEFQSHILYTGHLDAVKPALSAFETLAFWAQIYASPASNIMDALQAMGLERLADHPVRTLSAGQRRRLGLARLALIDRPLWLLDEPTWLGSVAKAAGLLLLPLTSTFQSLRPKRSTQRNMSPKLKRAL